jgi:hypothetical protein
MGTDHLVVIYGLDLLIALLAIGAAAMANLQRTREPFPRWHLLLPGLLAFAGALILFSDPDIRDLAVPLVWLVGTGGTLAGAARGALIRLDCDQTHRLVRVNRGGDAAWAAWAMVLFATIQGSIETGLNASTAYEQAAEFLMLLAGGYLLGRSIVTWLRARAATHRDLHEAREPHRSKTKKNLRRM